MSEYQAVFDAVRSKMTNCDIGQAVEMALRDCNLSHYAEMIMHRAQEACSEYDRPSSIHKPKLSIDGNMWCALYGDNLQDGVAGFGASPREAMWDFDRNWDKALTVKSTSDSVTPETPTTNP